MQRPSLLIGLACLAGCISTTVGNSALSQVPGQLPASVSISNQALPNKWSRKIETDDFLYIRNFSPESWPDKTSPTPPHEELYRVGTDLDSNPNLVDDPEFQADRIRLSDLLSEKLRNDNDSIFALDDHATFEVQGWRIHLNETLWREHPVKTKKMLTLLAAQLDRVIAAVPERALVQIRKVPIWINPTPEGATPTAAFHPNRRWLKNNGRNPAMAESVEITNVLNFEFENTRMPMLMLHELAHAYHHLILDFRNPEIRAAFESAKESGSYEQVKRFDGRKFIMDKAYGMNNEKEYFAETSEAYFGTNDFFPFNQAELKLHDPGMHDLLTKLWGVERNDD